jgi:hypothetical protein
LNEIGIGVGEVQQHLFYLPILVGWGEGIVLAEGIIYLLSKVSETFFAQALQEDVGKGFVGCNAIP